ncbi:MAG: glycosyltransferase family 2 protein [Candidatus Sumerlaeia bacterium]
MARSTVTALIPSFNEQANMADVLASVAWADEVFVVDSFSADQTVEIAKAAGARVVQHEYVNSATQKNWALPQVTTGWVLIVDADERVTPELRDEILAVLEADGRGDASVQDGYRIGRLNHFLGQRVRYCGWQNDSCLRLFRSEAGKYQDREVHADVEIASGRVGRLRGKLLHYTFVSFAQYMRKFDRYTTWAAGDRARRTRRVGFSHLALRPAGRFLKQYVLKRGFLDGRIGLVVCSLASYSVFMKYAKLLERQLAEKENGRNRR